MSDRKLENLIARLKKGDKSAFGELYDATYRTVYLTALRIMSETHSAEDVAQNVFVRFMEKLDLYQEGNVVGFLVTMTKRLALNEIKSQARVVPTDYTENDLVDSKNLSDTADTPLMDFAVKHLPEDEYEILMMAEISGYKRREIANILSLPLSTVTYKYLKAIKYLKEHFR